jgi:hypothetical protein
MKYEAKPLIPPTSLNSPSRSDLIRLFQPALHLNRLLTESTSWIPKSQELPSRQVAGYLNIHEVWIKVFLL